MSGESARLQKAIDRLPAWVPCPCCDEFACLIHLLHVFECPCPPIDQWESDPYTDKVGDKLHPQFLAWMLDFLLEESDDFPI